MGWMYTRIMSIWSVKESLRFRFWPSVIHAMGW